ncbi:MAG: hypothetical protein ACE5DO_10210 [Desulfobacterales bacterium]
MIKRSSRVGEYPQAIDVLGGHIHPRDHAVSGIPDPFTAMRDELLEEIDLTVSQDETFECIGLVETANTRKPELIFHVNSKLPEQKIIEKGRQKQSPEISDLFSIANNRVEILAFLNRSKEHMSFSAIGALWLYAHSIA